MKLFEKLTAYLRHENTLGIQLREMDAFRGWACLWVVFYHCSPPVKLWEKFDYKSSELLKDAVAVVYWSGGAGVDLFFFISGFLLFLGFIKAHNEGRPGPALGTFYRRRALRIAPAYYVSLLILTVFFASTFKNNKGVWDVVSHALFLHNVSPKYILSINRVYWSLAPEAQFYLVLPFIAAWFYWDRWKAALPAVIAACMVYRLAIVNMYGFGQGSSAVGTYSTACLPWRLDQFAVGMCFAALWVKISRDRERYSFITSAFASKVMASGILLLTCLLVVRYRLGYYFGDANWFEIFQHPLFSALFGIIVISSFYSGSYIKKMVCNPVIETLGIISYSVYLWHYVIIKLLVIWVPALIPPDNLVRLVLLTALALPISVMVGALSYIAFEKPFLKKRLSIRTVS